MEEQNNELPAETPKKSIAEKLNLLAIPFATFIAGAAVASSFFIFYAKPVVNAQNQPTQQLSLDQVKDTEHIIGTSKAKVIIVEYSDTECPFCKIFHETMRKITGEYPASDVSWVYRHFPLPMHTKAPQEALATECAAKLGGNEKFWQYTSRIFELTPSNNGLDASVLPQIAAEIGLDKTAFATCLTDTSMRTIVEKDAAGGTKAGVSGTPHSLIVVKGQVVGVINGAQPYESVKGQIDEALKL